VLGIELLPALLAGDMPPDASVAVDLAVWAICGRLAVQALELERLFERQPNQDSPPAAINEISTWRVIPLFSHGAPLPKSMGRAMRRGAGHRPI
jgi:hypothetical protein